MSGISKNKVQLDKQKKIYIGLGIAAVIIVSVLFYKDYNDINNTRTEEVVKRNLNIGDIEDIGDLENTWLSESRNRLEVLERKLNAYESRQKSDQSDKDRLVKRMEELERTNEENEANAKSTIDFLTKQLEEEKARKPEPIITPNPGTVPQNPTLGNINPITNAGFSQGGIVDPNGPENPLNQNSGLQIVSFEKLPANPDQVVSVSKTYDPESYLPPNSYAPAKVLVGVDASAGVKAQSNPRPVLFRITGPAISAMTSGEFLETPLDGCTVNGSASGDLSSEKVYVKLQKMTCNLEDGSVAVTDVKGYVAFAGKAGVRGNVVSREGDLITGALLAGGLEGIGKGFQTNTQRAFTPFAGASNQQLSTSQILKGGGGSAVANAAKTMQQYLIDRAEQYQPVIEMPVGIEVNLVFLEGAYLTKGE